jgi:hypothetical protein
LLPGGAEADLGVRQTQILRLDGLRGFRPQTDCQPTMLDGADPVEL